MTAYYNEIDPKAAAWLRELIKRNLIAPGEVDERSIIDVRPDDLRGFTQCHFFAGIGVWSYALRSAGWADDRPVWTGSCPCQPFSAAGKGDEFADERHLWPAWFRLARELRPDAIFGEQVSSEDAIAWFDHVRVDLEGEGYALGVLDTCAAGVGAPHIRQRLYFVAEDTRLVAVAWPGRSATDHDDWYRRIERLANAERRAAERYGHELGSAAGGSESEGHQRQRLRPDLGNGGEPVAVAHTESGRFDRQHAPEHRARERAGRGDFDDRGILGHPSSGGLGIERDEAQPGSSGHADGAEQLGVMGDAEQPGSQGRERPVNVELHGTAREDGSVAAASILGPTNGFWSDAEWIACRDGKARPVEPGTSPLVTGAPARVVRLRGYGNAINAEQARNFIEAYQDVRAGL